MSRPLFVLLALTIVLGAGILRGVALRRFSLGNDEIQEVRWSRLSWTQQMRAIRNDAVHPPLEPLLQGILSRLGTADWARRLPSAAAGTLTVALVIFLGRRWFGAFAGLAAGMLLAASPIHVRYSQEVRPYALGLLFLVASVAALERFRRSPKAGWALAGFASVLAAAYTLYFAGLVAALVGVFFVWLYRRGGLEPLWRRLPAAVLGWALLYAPWLPVVLAAATGRPPVEREPLGAAWWTYRLQVFGTGDWRVEPLSAGSYAFWFLVIAGIAVSARSRPAATAAFWFLIGCAVEIAILQLRPHFSAVRYLLPAWIGAVLLAGCGAGLLNRRWPTRVLAAIAVVLVVFFDALTLIAYYDHGRPRWDEVARFLSARVRPGERVIAANGWVRRNLGYYWIDEGLGRPGFDLERLGTEAVGPAWMVLAACAEGPAARAALEPFPVVLALPTTNHCEIRFLPAGARVRLPQGVCTPND